MTTQQTITENLEQLAALDPDLARAMRHFQEYRGSIYEWRPEDTEAFNTAILRMIAYNESLAR